MNTPDTVNRKNRGLIAVLAATALIASMVGFAPPAQAASAPVANDDTFVIDEAGTIAPGEISYATVWYGFDTPSSVDVDSSGNVYVLDNSNHRVRKFDSSGNSLLDWGTSGNGDTNLYYPFGLAIDSADNVYVADSGNDRIVKYDSAGTLLVMWGWGVDTGAAAFETCTSSCQAGVAGGGDGQIDRTHGLGIDSADNVFVADYNNHRIQKFDSTGTFIRTWGYGVQDGTAVLQNCTSGCQAGLGGSGDGQVNYPYEVEVDTAGSVYVSDAFNRRVQKYDNNGGYLLKWGTQGDGDGQFNTPKGIAVDGAGDVYVADGNIRVQKFTNTGTYLYQWGAWGSDPGEFLQPNGIGISGSGAIYVSESQGDRVQKFLPVNVLSNDTDADGDPLTAVIVTPPSDASSFTLHSDGSFDYVHDSSDNPTDSFTYKANDGTADSNVATVTLNVALNDAPAAVNDTATVRVGETINEAAPGVLENDTDTENDDLSAVLVTPPAYHDTAGSGAFALSADGSYVYVHDGSATSSDSFTYRAADATDESNLATVNITITVNQPPVAVADLAAVEEGATLTADRGVQTSWAAGFDGPTGLGVDRDSGYVYALNSGFGKYVNKYDRHGNFILQFGSYGDEAHQWRVPEGLAVTPTGDVVVVDRFRDRVLRFDGDGTYLGALTGVGFSSPHGVAVSPLTGDIYVMDVVSSVGELKRFDSDGVYIGTFGSFNGSYFPNPAVSPVTGTVFVADGGNDRIQYFQADGTYIGEWAVDNAVEIAIDENDEVHVLTSYPYKYIHLDTTGQELESWGVGINAARALDLDADGSLYIFLSNFTISKYRPPSVLLNDTDDGDPLTAILEDDVSHGSLTLNANGTFTYTHDGTETPVEDSFTYKAYDGTYNSNIVTVTITITPVNDAPVAVVDDYGVDEGAAVVVEPDGVLTNDSDAEDDSLTAVLVTPPSHHVGTFTLNSDGSFTYTHDGSETTGDSFTYEANDGLLDSNVVTVTITITGVNDAPVATGDDYDVDEGAAVVVEPDGVLTNDSDAEDDSLTAVLVTPPSHHVGTFTLNSDGSFTYTHDGSETTGDSFTYEANDGLLDSNVVTVTITITGVNDAPVATGDDYDVDEGAAVVVEPDGVLTNDSDAEDDSLTAVLVTPPSHHVGTFTLNSDGSFTYTHDGSETTGDSFTYEANDGLLDSNVVTVTITITGVNDAPVATGDDYDVDEGAAVVVEPDGVLTNDSDAEDDSLTAVLVTPPSHHVGTFTLNSDGSFTYTHDGSETTGDSFTYEANDGLLDSNVVTVTITITGVNDAPVATGDDYDVDEGAAVVVEPDGVLTNDSDAEDDSLTAVLVTPPSHHVGTFTLNSDGSFTYTHDGSETTGDSFTYEANDGLLDSNVVTVTITITPVDDPPTAVVDFATVLEDAAATTVDVLSNDSDVDAGPRFVESVTQPANGAVAITNGGLDLTYEPDPDYCNAPPSWSTDDFTYTLNGGSEATVHMTVTCAEDPPVANPDAYTVSEGGVLTAHALTMWGNEGTGNGQFKTPRGVAVDGWGNVYVADVYNHRIQKFDGSGGYLGQWGIQGTGDGELERPVAVGVDGAGNVYVADMGNNRIQKFDSSGGYLGQWGSSGTGNGQFVNPYGVAVDGVGNVYVADTYNHRIQKFDSSAGYVTQWGSQGSEPGEFDYPFGVAVDGAGNVYVADTYNHRIQKFDGTGGYLDEWGIQGTGDGQLDSPLGVGVDGWGNVYVVDNGNDRIQKFDSSGGYVTQWDNQELGDGQFRPQGVGVDSWGNVYVGDRSSHRVVRLDVGVLGNDIDVDGDSLTAAEVTGTSNAASFTLAGDGSFTYSHDGSETTGDSFTYKANDGVADSNTVTVSITITPVNDAPVATGDDYDVDEGATVVVEPDGVLGNDTDGEDDGLSAVLVSAPSHHVGTFTLNSDGSFTYSHDGSETTSDSFTYKANDGLADSNTVTVTITITPVNDAPVAVADSGVGFGTDEDVTFTTASVLGNDSDVDGSLVAATAEFDDTSTVGGLTPVGDGTFGYVPEPDWFGSDSFAYRVQDDLGVWSNWATVTIVVASINDAPVAVGDSGVGFGTDEDVTFTTGSVLVNDDDVDGSLVASSVEVDDALTVGGVSDLGDGTFSYVPVGDWFGSDSFAYRVQDDLGVWSNWATVTIVVASINDPPVADPDAYSVLHGESLTVWAPGVLGNDTDVEDDPLTAVLVDPPNYHAGTFVLNTDGSFSYVHDGSETMSDSFTYVANDGLLDSVAVQVAITVESSLVDTVALSDVDGDGHGELAVLLYDDGAGRYRVVTKDAVDGGPVSEIALPTTADAIDLEAIGSEIVALYRTSSNGMYRIRRYDAGTGVGVGSTITLGSVFDYTDLEIMSPSELAVVGTSLVDGRVRVRVDDLAAGLFTNYTVFGTVYTADDLEITPAGLLAVMGARPADGIVRVRVVDPSDSSWAQYLFGGVYSGDDLEINADGDLVVMGTRVDGMVRVREVEPGVGASLFFYATVFTGDDLEVLFSGEYAVLGERASNGQIRVRRLDPTTGAGINQVFGTAATGIDLVETTAGEQAVLGSDRTTGALRVRHIDLAGTTTTDITYP